jgi:hypothetical protein
MKLTTKQAVQKLGNNSVVHEIRDVVKIIPCFKNFQLAQTFLRHIGRYITEKTGKLVFFKIWYNGLDGYPKRLEYSFHPKSLQEDWQVYSD